VNKKVNLTDEQIAARNPHYSYQDLLDREKVDVPDSLRESTETYLGCEDLAIERWTSREFHELEVEKMWSKTWQMACRESQLKESGDYFVYDIVDASILITRTPSGELKAYHNSCLHRARALKRGSGNADELRCPFHGFTWNLDGGFEGAPCQWDFPHIEEEEFNLPEVRVSVWAGWVMINMDDDAPSLEEYMGIIPQHFKRWKHEQRYISMHVQKVINANWKACAEAFIESYHAIQTHPQIMSYQGIDNSQYDVWGDNVSRTITPSGIVNPSHEDQYSAQDTVDSMLGTSVLVADTNPEDAQVDNNAREKIADINREPFGGLHGEDISGFATQSELMDSNLYLLFPNFAPWAGFGPVLTYRHRPNGDDHESCIMDIFFMHPYPEGEEHPGDARTTYLGAEQPFSDANDVMGEGLARIFDQDGANLPQVQKGMKASKKGAVTLANYQEVRIRHFHQTLDKYLQA
jgi:phenylpropionate dioxygenase-like ring-hydroxylating dioxygenase large terminal subunit